MKKNYIFCAVIGVILASTVYYFKGVWVMLSVLLIYMMLSRIILKQRAGILRQRSEWIANPTSIATVWCEQASAYEEKLRTSRKLERHLNLLTYAIEYKRISENA